MEPLGFEEFVLARSASLARAAYLLTGDHHAAQDLLQDTLARVAERWERISRPGADPEPYVRRVLTTRSIDGWRVRVRRPVEVELLAVAGDPVSPATNATDRVTDALLLQQALMRVTPRQRAVLVLRFYWDLTEVQTAAALDCSPNTVKSQTRLALQRLRDLAPELLSDLRPEESG